MGIYFRYLTPGSPPFDPIALARETERRACKGLKRKYTSFYATGVYGGIATGYTVGCCLRCYYCWVNRSREYPEKFGTYFSPEEVVDKLVTTAKERGVKKARISGSEPTICKPHILGILEGIQSTELDLFILETNGILFGNDEDYVKKLKDLEGIHIRVCIKAGNPEGFQSRTGAMGQFYELPFRGVEYLHRHGISFHVAAMTDPRIMLSEERKRIIMKLAEIDPEIAYNLEEEIIDPYDNTMIRLEKAGVDLDWDVYRRMRG